MPFCRSTTMAMDSPSSLLIVATLCHFCYGYLWHIRIKDIHKDFFAQRYKTIHRAPFINIWNATLIFGIRKAQNRTYNVHLHFRSEQLRPLVKVVQLLREHWHPKAWIPHYLWRWISEGFVVNFVLLTFDKMRSLMSVIHKYKAAFIFIN